MSDTLDFTQALTGARRMVADLNKLGFHMDTFETLPGGRAVRLSLWHERIDGGPLKGDAKRWVTVPAGLGTDDFYRLLSVKLKFLASSLGVG